MENYQKNRAEIIAKMLENEGYIHCQHCGTSQSFKFTCHHIYFRSEKQYHPMLHHKRNLIIVCNKHHDMFHGNKDTRIQLVNERKLDELFG